MTHPKQLCHSAKPKYWSYRATQSSRIPGKRFSNPLVSLSSQRWMTKRSKKHAARAASSSSCWAIHLRPLKSAAVWAKSHRYCNVPILELHRGGAPELVERNVFAHESQRADDFMAIVQSLLRKPKNGRA